MSSDTETKALQLRTQALALLEQAQSLDGLKPFIVMHQHNYGSSGYLCWFDREPTADEAATCLDAEFEPNRNETLFIEGSITLDELTAVSLSARLAEQLQLKADAGDSSHAPSRR